MESPAPSPISEPPRDSAPPFLDDLEDESEWVEDDEEDDDEEVDEDDDE